jgi:hypothetical protein
LVATEKTSPTLPTLVNRAVTLYSGYMDLNESDYAPIGYGQIDAVEMTADGLAVRFSLVDLRRHQFDDLFRNAEAGGIEFNSRLSADANAGAVSIVPLTTNGLSEGDHLYLGPSTHGSYVGEEEKVSIRSIAGGTLYLGDLNQVPLAKSF